MVKFASVALAAALGVAGVAHTVPAKADPRWSVDIGFPGVAVVAPFGYAPGYYAPYYPPYFVGYGRYWHRDYDRDRYEHYRGHWDRGHWDRDGGRHWDHDGERHGDRR